MVTLHCAALNEKIEMLYWYKQSLGYNPKMVASEIYKSRQIYPSFNSRFNVSEGTHFNLTIKNVKKADEANYFCHQGNQFMNIWTNGIFLTVKGNVSVSMFHIFNIISKTFSLKGPQLNLSLCLMMIIVFNCADHNDQRFVSQTVVQQPVLASVQLGDLWLSSALLPPRGRTTGTSAKGNPVCTGSDLDQDHLTLLSFT